MSSNRICRRCPVCHARRPQPFLHKGELEIVQCAECSMVYASPVAEEFVAGAYYDRTAAGYYLTPEKLQGDYADTRFERELKLLRAYCAGGRVLDVGCSTGAFLFQLTNRFPRTYDILGTDVSGPALEYAESRRVPVCRGDFLQQELPGASFDAITFWAVLEHLDEPGKFLAKARTLLKASGHCFVLVPNLRSLAARMLGSRYRYIYPQHLNYFSSSTLTRLANNDFEVVAMVFTHFNPVVIWQDWRSGGAEVSNAQRGQLLQRTTRWKNSSALKPARLLYSAAERVLAATSLADNVVLVLKPRQPSVG